MLHTRELAGISRYGNLPQAESPLLLVKTVNAKIIIPVDRRSAGAGETQIIE
jgi:hypothetical protein